MYTENNRGVLFLRRPNEKADYTHALPNTVNNGVSYTRS